MCVLEDNLILSLAQKEGKPTAKRCFSLPVVYRKVHMVLGHPVLNFMVLMVCVNCDLFSLHHTIVRISCAFITSLVSPNLEKDCM